MVPTSGSTSAAGAGVPKMRMAVSCNGCRALRKACSHDCAIRPCLQWIDTADAQANATVFLAKFYGRAGLQNLIAAAPGGDADRPAVFRSLLYEACGRIVNPVYGSVGLLWSHQWQKCVDAVEAVFKGDLAVPGIDDPNPVVQAGAGDAASSEANADAAPALPPPLAARPGASSAACDIRHRHFAKDSDAAAVSDLVHFARANRGRRRGYKRPGSSSKSSKQAKLPKGKGKGKAKAKASNNDDVRASPSPPLGQQQQEAEELEPVPTVMELDLLEHGHHLQGSKENTDVEAASDVIQAEAVPPVGGQVLAADQEAEEEVVGLELTLGFEPAPVVRQQPRSSCGDQTGVSDLWL